MQKANIACGPVQNQGWGLTQVRLPGGGHLGVYQPHRGPAGSWPVKPRKRREERPTRPEEGRR